jgi:hypothetical protein
LVNDSALASSLSRAAQEAVKSEHDGAAAAAKLRRFVLGGRT